VFVRFHEHRFSAMFAQGMKGMLRRMATAARIIPRARARGD